MRVIVLRCQNGIVVWIKARAVGAPRWVCERDAFQIVAPVTAQGVEAFLTGIAQHSVGLAGPILQVTQLEL